jgi:rhodanese-related sulfurtransferase
MQSKLIFTLVIALLIAAGCSSDGSTEAESTPTSSEVASSPDAETSDALGVRLVSATEGAEIQADPPADLVILDVRTPDEFAEGHIEGAILIDFYADDFGDQLTELDPGVPYLLYCRSGNRSSLTASMMQNLGFTDVADVDGGIGAWTSAGHPLVTS